ncbi:MAG: ATP-binding protein [Bacteroidota bacterium]|nr:PAS domain-containing sensor histidine kinase [Candidatus Kapabacteria bacterium]MDW8219432.1 ATP-binding protein [Bacteroidota bacterium]
MLSCFLGLIPSHDIEGTMAASYDAPSEFHLRKRFQAIFNNTFQFIFVVHVDGTVLEINQAAINFTGISAHEARERFLWDLNCWLNEAARSKLQASLYRASGGEFIRYTTELVSAEDIRAVIDLSIKPIFNSDGNIDFFIVEGRDITSLKRMEFERDRERQHAEALHRINEMKNEFVSQVSHELRTPLASIIGFAQTLLRSPHLAPDKVQQFLTIILDDGRRLERLVEDLLDIARIESGTMHLVRQPSDIRTILEYAISIIAPEAEYKRITITQAYLDTHLPLLSLDPDRITQVFVNLLANAVKFTPPNGSITVSATRTSEYVQVAVQDTGIGIAEHDLPRLFEKFFRVKQKDSNGQDIRGTGLGLSIAKQIVELHGGTIRVQSIVGQGSTFSVIIPLSSHHDE